MTQPNVRIMFEKLKGVFERQHTATLEERRQAMRQFMVMLNADIDLDGADLDEKMTIEDCNRAVNQAGGFTILHDFSWHEFWTAMAMLGFVDAFGGAEYQRRTQELVESGWLYKDAGEFGDLYVKTKRIDLGA
jgi:hypothetical protein